MSLVILCSCTDVSTLVDQISQNNLLESEYIGFGGGKSDEYKRFKKLSKIATNKELEELITNDHPIVRTYALQLMLERKLINSEKAFRTALQDNESFAKMNGDIGGSSDVCTEIYYSALNKYPTYDFENMEHIPVQNKEMNLLDSIVIYGIKEDHFLHYLALRNKTHNHSFNKRIIELALKQRAPSAIEYIEQNNITVDTAEMINSIQYIIDNKFIGSIPKERMNKLVNNLKGN